jgi:hypothetical protein
MNARKLSPLDRAEIAALKARGESSASIGIRFRISSDSVRRIAKLALHDPLARLKLCGCSICELTIAGAQS